MDDEDDDRSARAPEPDDVIRICRALNEAGARFLLIGGFAVIAHGAGRFTKDIDLQRHVVVRVADEVVVDLMGRACGLSYAEASRDGETLRFAATLAKPLKQSQLFDTLVTLLSPLPLAGGGPGRGSNTTRTVPSRLDAAMAQRHPLRILLAEDNVVNQKLALRLLQQMGYRADLASNGIEAIESVQRQVYDVVLMDVQMPEMDGLEASRQICARWAPGERPRIVVMTANAMAGDREMCLAAGMDGYITKPIRVEALVEALATWNGRTCSTTR